MTVPPGFVVSVDVMCPPASVSVGKWDDVNKVTLATLCVVWALTQRGLSLRTALTKVDDYNFSLAA